MGKKLVQQTTPSPVKEQSQRQQLDTLPHERHTHHKTFGHTAHEPASGVDSMHWIHRPSSADAALCVDGWISAAHSLPSHAPIWRYGAEQAVLPSP